MSVPRGQQVGVRTVSPPFVSNAINTIILVAHEEARFEPMHQGGVILIGGQFKMFHENRAGRKSPFVGWRESDLFPWRIVCAVVWHRDPTLLIRAIRPEGR